MNYYQHLTLMGVVSVVIGLAGGLSFLVPRLGQVYRHTMSGIACAWCLYCCMPLLARPFLPRLERKATARVLAERERPGVMRMIHKDGDCPPGFGFTPNWFMEPDGRTHAACFHAGEHHIRTLLFDYLGPGESALMFRNESIAFPVTDVQVSVAVADRKL